MHNPNEQRPYLSSFHDGAPSEGFLAVLGVIETPSPDRQSGIVAVGPQDQKKHLITQFALHQTYLSSKPLQLTTRLVPSLASPVLF